MFLEKLMSCRSITCTYDPLDEFHVKVSVSKSKNHLQNLKESSRILQKCFRNYRLLQNSANAVNLCAALKTESLFSLKLKLSSNLENVNFIVSTKVIISAETFKHFP